jgi:hypothetical protein
MPRRLPWSESALYLLIRENHETVNRPRLKTMPNETPGGLTRATGRLTKLRSPPNQAERSSSRTLTPVISCAPHISFRKKVSGPRPANLPAALAVPLPQWKLAVRCPVSPIGGQSRTVREALHPCSLGKAAHDNEKSARLWRLKLRNTSFLPEKPALARRATSGDGSASKRRPGVRVKGPHMAIVGAQKPTP